MNSENITGAELLKLATTIEDKLDYVQTMIAYKLNSAEHKLLINILCDDIEDLKDFAECMIEAEKQDNKTEVVL